MGTKVRKQLVVVGFIGLVLAIVGQLMLAGAPAMDDSPASIRSWFADNRSLALAAAYIAALGLTAHVTLILALRDRLRVAEGSGTALSDLIMPATILWLAVVMIGIGTISLLGYRAAGMTDESARELNDASYLAFGAAGFGTALALGCVAVAVLRTRALPAWFGWFSAATACLHLIAAAALAQSGAATPKNASLVAIVYYIWVVAAGVLLIREPSRASAPDIVAPAEPQASKA